MLEGSVKDLTKIAADPSTPSHLLIELGKHKDSQIRSLVASNPNTPLETLKCLGKEFADAIVENPVFDLLQLEDSNSKFVRLTLARSTKTPPEILAKLITKENRDFEVCWAVAENINTPIYALANFLISIANGTTGYVPSSNSRFRFDIKDWSYISITKQIDRRLKGEHLAETDKFYTYWAIATEKEIIKDRYSWENLYQPDPQARN